MWFCLSWFYSKYFNSIIDGIMLWIPLCLKRRLTLRNFLIQSFLCWCFWKLKEVVIANVLPGNYCSVRSSHLDVFCKKCVLKKFDKKSPVPESLVQGLKPATLLKKWPSHRYFPLNFAKFLRTLYISDF